MTSKKEESKCAKQYEPSVIPSPTRKRRIEKEDIQNEALIQVLTMQILLCILLIAAVYLLKVSGTPIYSQVRDEYNRMFDQSGSVTWEDLKNIMQLPLDSIIDQFSSYFDGASQTSPSLGVGGLNLSGSATAMPADASFAPVVVTAKPLVPVNGTISSTFG
jgi:hypothetical protein